MAYQMLVLPHKVGRVHPVIPALGRLGLAGAPRQREGDRGQLLLTLRPTGP